MIAGIAPIKMDTFAARRACREYSGALKKKWSAADALLRTIYHRLSRGGTLLNIADAFRATGLDAQGRPKLAMMRADKKDCILNKTWRNSGPGQPSGYFWTMYPTYSGNGPQLNFWLKDEWFGEKGITYTKGNSQMSRAIVPSIPPRFRPDGPLDKYWLLWEAEWEQITTDPYLLRHIGGPFYAILAMWDLTEVERAVLDFQSTKR